MNDISNRKLELKEHHKMKEQINLSMIKNILTLRYDPTISNSIFINLILQKILELIYEKLDIDKIESIISEKQFKKKLH